MEDEFEIGDQVRIADTNEQGFIIDRNIEDGVEDYLVSLLNGELKWYDVNQLMSN